MIQISVDTAITAWQTLDREVERFEALAARVDSSTAMVDFYRDMAAKLQVAATELDEAIKGAGR